MPSARSIFADITPLKRSPEFRRLWWGLGVSNIGSQFTMMAVSLQIFAITNSTFTVGLLGLFTLIPTIILGLYGGAWLDRYDRRKIAVLATLVQWASTGGLCVQAWLGLGNVWILYALMAIQAGAASVNSPARSSIIPKLLPLRMLPAANALTGMTWNVALTLGPMLGGIVVGASGYKAAYTIDAISFAFALYAIIRLPRILPDISVQTDKQGNEIAPTRGWRSVAEGLRYLTTMPNVRMTFLIDMSAMVLAQPRALYPEAGAILGGGATTSGLLAAAMAIGSLIAGVLSGPVARTRFQGRVIAWAVSGWGLGIAGFGAVLWAVGNQKSSHPLWVSIIIAGLFLAFAGAADAVSAALRSTILQSAAPDDMRGRLQGVFTVVVTGGPNLGQLVSGAETTAFSAFAAPGIGPAGAIGGLTCILGVIGLMKWQSGFLTYDADNPQP